MAAALGVAAVGASTSCSSGGGSSGGATTAGAGAAGATTRALSAKEVFVRDANALCREMKAKGEALTSGASTVTDPAALTQLFQQMGDLVDQYVGKLRSLPVPAGDEATVTAALAAMAEAGRTTVAAGAAPPGTVQDQAVAAQAAAQQRSDELVRAYGLTDCAFG